MNPLSTVGVWRACKRALGGMHIPDSELSESVRHQVEELTRRQIVALDPSRLPPSSDWAPVPPLQIICWFCISHGKRNLAFYEKQLAGPRRPEGRYFYRCYFCGNGSTLYADDVALYMSDVVCMTKGENRFPALLIEARAKEESGRSVPNAVG